MKKLIVLLFLLLTGTVFAQTTVVQKWRVQFPNVEKIRTIWTNDGLDDLVYDSSIRGIADWLNASIDDLAPDKSYALSTGTRIVKVNDLVVPASDGRGGLVARHVGKTIFVAARDLKFYIVLYVDIGKYQYYFQREENPGGAYDGRIEPRILTVLENADRRGLYDLLLEMLPYSEQSSGKG